MIYEPIQHSFAYELGLVGLSVAGFLGLVVESSVS